MLSIRASNRSFPARASKLANPSPSLLISAFAEANKVLDAFVKSLRKSGKIAGAVHKESMTEERIQQLFESGELGPLEQQKIQRSS